MSSRRIACLVLGGWLALSVVVPLSAMYFVYFGERALARVAAVTEHPSANSTLRPLRAALGAAAGDHVRIGLRLWTQVQLGLGLVLFGILFFGRQANLVAIALPLVMLLVVIVSHYGIQPSVTFSAGLHELGTGATEASERARIHGLRQFYLLVESLKLLIGLSLALVLVQERKVRRRRRSDSGPKFNVVDHADHRHIDR
jgi:hypothetical protein